MVCKQPSNVEGYADLRSPEPFDIENSPTVFQPGKPSAPETLAPEPGRASSSQQDN